jgi:hypothetical protein
MNVHFATITLILTAALAGGCTKNRQPAPLASGAATGSPSVGASTTNSMPQATGSDADAVRAAIEDHLRNNHGINMAAMDMTVDSVSINGDQAQANASFRLKQGGTGMVMTYFLQRQGNGWLVVRDQPSGGQFAHPPMDKTHSGAAAGQPTTPAMPDVSDFLKNHAPPDSN